MSDHFDDEETSGGTAGKVVGRAKEVLGELQGSDELAREGRLQAAAAEAGDRHARAETESDLAEREADLQAESVATEAERSELEAEIDEEDQARRADDERRSAEAQADRAAAADAAVAQQVRATTEAGAERDRLDALAEKRAGMRAANELEAEARAAERLADNIDPEENDR